ncbi:MAG: PKD domain-containing protein, partial [Saprospiraceae bacterium]|nr:PKD domain-containing protein [Saprospiraceae bacterium]
MRLGLSFDGLEINFHNNSHNFIDQIWDFGDGGSFSIEKLSHKYDSPGCMEIKLTTISACGDTSIISNGVNFCIKGDCQIDKKFKFKDRVIYDMN